MNKEKINLYLSGEKLYGDDFQEEEILQWYKKEEEGYANQFGVMEKNKKYEYEDVTNMYAYKYIANIECFNDVLGFGASWGYEFNVIAKKIKNLIILDSSTQTCSSQIGTIKPKYVLPSHTGVIPFEKDKFDLITCFGTLHHIPNVTFVMQELYRVLKPGGIICLREPIRSMGDWNNQRQYATACERGIPAKIFDKIISDLGYKIINKDYCYTCRGSIQRIFGHSFSCTHTYNIIDKYISKLFKNNIHYHPTSWVEKLSPSIVFYVLRK
ncbi:methyltransferase domain-containing protein [Bacteroides sp.]